MGKRRLLPEAAYDFWAVDCRGGERGSVRNTIAEARKDARAMRAPLEWYQRRVIEVWWRVSERKVLRLLISGKYGR